ncbi:MAG: hypothetical protein K2M73_07385 [Lachnospiraceae bacterium]|nr:hypothetical protein [Lachnospiraceae bacterium]
MINNKKNYSKKANNNKNTNHSKRNVKGIKEDISEEKQETELDSDATGIDDIDVFDERKNDITDLKEIKEIDISRNIDKRDKDIVGNCRRVLKNKRKEEKETNIIDDIKKNIILWSVLAVLFIVLIIAIILTNTGEKKENDDKKDTKETETTTEELTTEEDENEQLKAEASDSPITVLISNYLKAERIDVSMDEVNKYVDNSDKISLEKYEVLKKYIEEYQNVTCYKLSSIDENISIVVTTYGCKFFNIETAAPGCETFIVINRDGKYLVHNLTVQESIDTYISSDVDVSLINQINKEINDSLKSAMASDEELANVIAVLSGSDS